MNRPAINDFSALSLLDLTPSIYTLDFDQNKSDDNRGARLAQIFWRKHDYVQPVTPHNTNMVLSDLGRRINSAVNDLTRSATLDEKAFEGMVKEICNALVEADVNIKLDRKSVV